MLNSIILTMLNPIYVSTNFLLNIRAYMNVLHLKEPLNAAIFDCYLNVTFKSIAMLIVYIVAM